MAAIKTKLTLTRFLVWHIERKMLFKLYFILSIQNLNLKLHDRKSFSSFVSGEYGNPFGFTD